jgi:hypothetical protein
MGTAGSKFLFMLQRDDVFGQRAEGVEPGFKAGVP